MYIPCWSLRRSYSRRILKVAIKEHLFCKIDRHFYHIYDSESQHYPMAAIGDEQYLEWPNFNSDFSASFLIGGPYLYWIILKNLLWNEVAAQHRDFTRGTRGKTWTWVLDLETFLLKMWQRKHCFTCVHIYSVPQIPDVGDQPSEKLPFNSATMEDHESDSWMLEIDLSHQNVINSVSVSPRKKKTFCLLSAEVAMVFVFI